MPLGLRQIALAHADVDGLWQLGPAPASRSSYRLLPLDIVSGVGPRAFSPAETFSAQRGIAHMLLLGRLACRSPWSEEQCARSELPPPLPPALYASALTISPHTR